MTTILHDAVAEAIVKNNLEAEEIACGPNFADTTAFNEKYGFHPRARRKYN